MDALNPVKKKQLTEYKTVNALRAVCFSLLLSLACLFSLSVHAASLPPLQLPSLTKQSVLNVPNVNDPSNVFIALGFHPKHQKLLENGMQVAKQLNAVDKTLKIYEIPVIESRYKSIQATIRPLMKARVNNKNFLNAIYPLYTDSKALKTNLGLKNQTEYAFLLCNAQGKVLWFTESQLTASDISRLKTQL